MSERKKYKQEVAEKQAKLKTAAKDWSEEQLREHVEKISKIYASSKNAQKLGNFDWDTENVYYWSTYDGNARKLPVRRELGWGFATKEDAARAGLLDTTISRNEIDGESCVEMSHNSARAVLLKIPKEVYEVNQRIRERVKNNKPIFDADGNSLDVKTSDDGHNIVGKRQESTVQLDDK